MPRKKNKSLIRPIRPDRIYNDVKVQRLINRVMLEGKKSLAENLVYKSLELSAKKLKVDNPFDVFAQAMKNIEPHIETRSRRIGGANYQIPFEVNPQRKTHLTIMWFVAAFRARKGTNSVEAMSAEFCDAYNNQGAAVKKKEDTHKMAEANRAFAHFARMS